MCVQFENHLCIAHGTRHVLAHRHMQWHVHKDTNAHDAGKLRIEDPIAAHNLY